MNTFYQSGLSIEDLIPHRESMLLIDEVIEVDSSFAVTSSVIADGWPLSDDTGVHPLILVEIAAQAAGVCNGWDRIKIKGKESDKMGFLVAIKSAKFFVEQISFGDEIIARAENAFDFGNLREVSCTLYCREENIAEVILQLFQA